jgi:hypothetical protein
MRPATVAALFVWLAPVAGCGESEPLLPAQMRVATGDGQTAPIGAVLPKPLAVTVLDARGQPLSGVRVDWRASGGDQLTPLAATTDATGRARAIWMLGTVLGARSAQATVPGIEPAVFTALAEAVPDETPPFDTPTGLDFATYEGSHQVVHPDFVATPGRAAGPPLHLAITPYPFGDARYENPSLFEGTRSDAWSVSPGTPNPVVVPDQGYLSDPDLVYLPEQDELWLYYRQVTGDNIVRLTRSHDGRQWSTPVEVVRAPNHQIVSPSVVRRAPGDWWMFAVNSGPVGCSAASTTVEVRRSADGLHWGPASATALGQAGLWPWHLDVQWIPSRQVFWAVYNAKEAGSCTTPAVYLAQSPDGRAWDVVTHPVLTKGVVPVLQDIVYRTTFEYEPAADAITFWFSGARFENGRYVWGAAVERRHRADVFVPPGVFDEPRLPPAPAPLEDWP